MSEEEMVATQVNVLVTPRWRNGPIVSCEIKPGAGSATYFDGPVIRLPPEEHFELHFELQVGFEQEGYAGALSWNASNPFRAKRNWCPGSNSPLDSQFAAPRLSGSTLVVGVRPTGPMNIVHYSLHFVDEEASNCACDPIIINGFRLAPNG